MAVTLANHERPINNCEPGNSPSKSRYAPAVMLHNGYYLISWATNIDNNIVFLLKHVTNFLVETCKKVCDHMQKVLIQLSMFKMDRKMGKTQK